MFETRLTDDGEWFLDTCLQAGAEGQVLFAEDFVHAIGPWYHAAVVVSDGWFRHYVDGELELETEIAFTPLGQGKTCVGVRINRVCWYKGAMRTADCQLFSASAWRRAEDPSRPSSWCHGVSLPMCAGLRMACTPRSTTSAAVGTSSVSDLACPLQQLLGHRFRVRLEKGERGIISDQSR